MTSTLNSTTWLNSLVGLSSDWALICCDAQKRPCDPQTRRPLSNWPTQPGFCIEEIQAYKPEAVGVLLGEKSGGLLAIDFDGEGSEEKFIEVFGRPSVELPKTIAWTSGRKNRRQLGYIVDRELWPFIKPKSYSNEAGKTVLEIRWNGQQSVIAGAHPLTNGYEWLDGCCPKDFPDPTEAPDWLIIPILAEEQSIKSHKKSGDAIQRAVNMLKVLNPMDFTGYWKWLRLGMSLHSVSPSLEGEWIAFSSQMPNFDRKECEDKWKSFGEKGGITIGTLCHWAKQYGYQEAQKEHQKGGIVPKGSKGGNVGKVEWVIEEFLARGGTTLLAAEAGSGKTSLLMRAAAAVEEGEVFLGQVRTKKGRVLFIQGDEPEAQSETKMYQMGLKDEIKGTPFDIRYMEGLLEYAWLEEQTKKYAMIVIDSATSVLAKEGGEVEDPEFSRLLYKISGAVSRNGSSCIITTHLRKSADGFKRKDITPEDIAGRSTIANAITDYFGLMRIGKDEQKWDDHYALKCLGKRNCKCGEVWQLQGDPESFWWGLSDITDGMPPRERKRIEEKVLCWFKDYPEPISVQALSVKLGTNYEHLRRICTGLYMCGELMRRTVPTKGRPTYEYSLSNKNFSYITP